MGMWQLKEISKETFLSFSDELKIKMHQQQFVFSGDRYDEIRGWLIANVNHPYHFDGPKISANNKKKHVWLMFVDVDDAAAFKLRWM